MRVRERAERERVLECRGGEGLGLKERVVATSGGESHR